MNSVQFCATSATRAPDLRPCDGSTATSPRVAVSPHRGAADMPAAASLFAVQEREKKAALEQIFALEKELDAKQQLQLEIEDLRSSKEVIQDPGCHPFKVLETEGKGNEDVYGVVATAFKEMNEYNPSRRYIVPELWNFKRERKATLKEDIAYAMDKISRKSRRRVFEF
ncbi:hypothetical protein RJ639_035394 [Escallonia herrerae]|uniref:Factor of DNA methylation 1-5/IDN2 domain-containing protein n=1 Tax=Escallonia herrerae TaxID=1293975 RepID=A0AA88WR04_9ASTE|nr:hypothetical protein RJ639_035394 [Escallonia herrerae]